MLAAKHANLFHSPRRNTNTCPRTATRRLASGPSIAALRKYARKLADTSIPEPTLTGYLSATAASTMKNAKPHADTFGRLSGDAGENCRKARKTHRLAARHHQPSNVEPESANPC